MGFPGGTSGKESACNAGDKSLIPGSGRSPGGGHGNPFHYSCLENPMDRGAQQATVHRVAKWWTRLKRLSIHGTLRYCPVHRNVSYHLSRFHLHVYHRGQKAPLLCHGSFPNGLGMDSGGTAEARRGRTLVSQPSARPGPGGNCPASSI